MPNLPTFTINNAALWTRLLLSFNNSPDAYKTWLKQQLQQHVQNYETEIAANQKAIELKAGLDAEWTTPVVP